MNIHQVFLFSRKIITMSTTNQAYSTLEQAYSDAAKSLIKLRFGFYFITLGSISYFIALIALSIYIFNIENWYLGVMLPSFLCFIGLFTVLMTLRYVLTLFQSINFYGKHQIFRKDEPELFDLIDEITLELGLKKFPKIFIENIDVIITEYDNQFTALFNPSKFNLILGIEHFQTLNRAELKALILHELRKYHNKDEFRLIQLRNWQFCTKIKFYTSELTYQTKNSTFTYFFFSFI